MSDKLTVAREYGAEFAHEQSELTVQEAAVERFGGDEKAQAAFIQGHWDECEAEYLRSVAV